MYVVVFLLDNWFFYVLDLGNNEVIIYWILLDVKKLKKSVKCFLVVKEGNGFCYFIFYLNGKWVFVVEEFLFSVVLVVYCKNGCLKELDCESILFKNYFEVNKVVDIYIYFNGCWFYVFNWGYNSLVMYEVEVNSGML